MDVIPRSVDCFLRAINLRYRFFLHNLEMAFFGNSVQKTQILLEDHERFKLVN